MPNKSVIRSDAVIAYSTMIDPELPLRLFQRQRGAHRRPRDE
jgi:hypothetical protein